MQTSSQQVIEFEKFRWIDLTNPSKQELKEFAGIHELDWNLVLDSLQPGHLPKMERLDKYTFIILRSYTAPKGERITRHGELSNKIAFFLNENRLITVHRKAFHFLQIERRDYDHPQQLFLDIAYQMILSFGEPVEAQSELIDRFERNLFLKSDGQIPLEELYFQKIKARIGKKLLTLTQSVMSQVNVREKYQTQLQNLRDELTHSLLLYEEILDDAHTLLNTYLSITSKRSNDVMKVLTIFSAFFLPLTFIVGIYGMNFEHMPELKWVNGYYYSLLLMAIIGLVIYLWFRRMRIL
ncbi:MAG: hypothetical protein KBF37_09085 [Saprospiraceae bacterium]|jgi:magnesium transporter|nr:hypothetical protein [Saprospiraceae bacterium]MBP9210460.1 hypothetical protein [Saprospiraceae bacterium]MBV6474157.1 Cobalt/magnesium transport protein CorA [Saprospiraceae bacterium]